MRKFVRHPSSIPIDFVVTREYAAGPDKTQLSNISNGGFSCCTSKQLQVGCEVQLRIPVIWPEYSGHGTVIWSCKVENGFEVGIAFATEDTFKTKMVEQLCQIEQYRQHVWSDEGRHIDGEQAAHEWIALFAEEFSQAFQQRPNYG